MIENNVVIRTDSLSRSFGEITAVKDLTLTVKRGEIFGLLGPNGAGKTTTVRMLATLLAPTRGEAWVAGKKIGEQDREIRPRIGLLPEAPGLYDGLSAEQNLAFYGKMYGVENLSGGIQRYLELLGLWSRRFEPVGTFSKGMRQKLAIARALLHEPEVLFLDEPTSGLDPQASRLVRDFIAGLRSEGRTIILCTHNLDEADRLCDRVAVLRESLLALDEPAQLRRQLFGRQVVFHLVVGSPEQAEILAGMAGVDQVRLIDNKLLVSVDDPEQRNPQLIRALVESGADIQFVGELKRRLEDVYLELVAGGEE